jgi:hypothetical protein
VRRRLGAEELDQRRIELRALRSRATVIAASTPAARWKTSTTWARLTSRAAGAQPELNRELVRRDPVVLEHVVGRASAASEKREPELSARGHGFSTGTGRLGVYDGGSYNERPAPGAAFAP